MNYPYANGTIKVIESDILDKSKLSKLLKVDKEDFVRTLIDSGYGPNSAKNIEEVIMYENEEVIKLLNEITPDKKHTDLFFFAFDCLNIKSLFKQKIFNINLDVFSKSGTIDISLLRQLIIDEDCSNGPKQLIDFIKKVKKAIEGVTSPRLISSIIDQHFYSYVLHENKNHILKKYLELKIDIANLSTLIRSTNLNFSLDQFLEMFIENGKIKKEVFIEAYPFKKEKEYLFNPYYNEKFTKVLKLYGENKDLNSFERQLNNYLLEFMSEFRNDSFDIGPIIYYYLKKEAEASNIRYIYATVNPELSDLLDY